MIKRRTFDVLVVGGGPAGLAAVSTLLQESTKTCVWVDPQFRSGRLINFTPVPSNTRTSLFVRYAEGCGGGDGLAMRKLRERRQDVGCELKLAAEMVREVAETLAERHLERLERVWGTCEELEQTMDGWNALFSSGESVMVEHVILATGAHPKPGPSIPFDGIIVDPETLLRPSEIQLTAQDTVGVVGNSHSAVLILMNLSKLPSPPRIINFHRKNLRYAEYLNDGRIKHDNTGLKGEAAEWAREGMAKVERVQLTDEQTVYDKWLPECTHLVWAIGYERNPLPVIRDLNGETVMVSGYDTEQRLMGTNDKVICNLYGLGIAFPERVIDPSGEQEQAVGLWKFMPTTKKLQLSICN
ncbi:hypothetical protein PSACC_03120 [Paramicrosporidium saccamoebae]|uniref:FAD/NAD(P)-binding domain-containing protein n=1 Tax=Paramicrosporidium saccamoebae TaxID=1246581 RepID=A0A2H9TH69_9FUNG|nr:hypothetical protein PSACC_03120 [Paramicrosporidium saccamoebae]